MAGDDVSVPDLKSETLTGDWGGLRSNLYKAGVDVQFTHKSDVLSNVSGGIKNGTAWLGHTEARVNLDMDKLLGWDSTNVYIHYHSDLGSKFNRDYVGGVVGVDNIEVGHNTAQFFHAWIQKRFFKDSLSVLAGLYPIDSEFYVTETSGQFIQPPYGMANELALTGKAGPPVFPVGALAVRVKYTTPSSKFYAMGAITDGVPGDPNDPNGTHIKLGNGDGTLSIAEFGYTPQPDDESANPASAEQNEPAELFNKTALGLWRYSGKFDALEVTGRRHHSYGAYVLAERTLFTEQGHPAQGLSGFVRFGVASAEVNPLDWTASMGLRYHGLIPGRDDDIAGIAVTINHASRDLHASEKQETDIEATYRAQIRPWLALQPNLQYIINPGMDAGLQNAWTVGFRTEVTF
jgi:porin